MQTYPLEPRAGDLILGQHVPPLVGTPKALLDKLEKQWIDKPWEQVHEGMRIKLLEQDGDLYVQAASDARKNKEDAMRRRKLKKLVRGLNRIRRALKRRSIGRDQVLRRVAVLRKEAGRVAGFLKIRERALEEPVSRSAFTAKLDKAAWKRAMERDGHYILRAHIPWEQWPAGMGKQAPVLWKWYMQLVRVEEAFKALKGGAESSPDPSPAPAPRGITHPGGVPGLLPEQQSADEAVGCGPWPDCARRWRPSRRSKYWRSRADDRRAGAADTALHRAGGWSEDDPGSLEADVAATVAAAHSGGESRVARRAARCGFVVQTFGVRTQFPKQK